MSDNWSWRACVARVGDSVGRTLGLPCRQTGSSFAHTNRRAPCSPDPQAWPPPGPEAADPAASQRRLPRTRGCEAPARHKPRRRGIFERRPWQLLSPYLVIGIIKGRIYRGVAKTVSVLCVLILQRYLDKATGGLAEIYFLIFQKVALDLGINGIVAFDILTVSITYAHSK